MKDFHVEKRRRSYFKCWLYHLKCTHIIILFQQPVIITGSDLVGSAYHWDLGYLCANLGNGLYTVYTSEDGKFKYYDEKKVPNIPSFQPPTSHTDMTFQEFASKLKQRNSANW